MTIKNRNNNVVSLTANRHWAALNKIIVGATRFLLLQSTVNPHYYQESSDENENRDPELHPINQYPPLFHGELS